MIMKFSVLTIENNVVKLENENGELSFLDLSELPKEIQVNDILEKNNGVFSILSDETNKRREENMSLINSLWED